MKKQKIINLLMIIGLVICGVIVGAYYGNNYVSAEDLGKEIPQNGFDITFTEYTPDKPVVTENHGTITASYQGEECEITFPYSAGGLK